MKQADMFGRACWLSSNSPSDSPCYILRGKIHANAVTKATLRVLGLGFFHCYINGNRVGDDLFLPLNTDYEPRPDFPIQEIVSNHRVYVPEYDITKLLRNGENLIAIHFGGGWYTYDDEQKFGNPKAIWRIFGESINGTFDFCSSPHDKISESFVSSYHLTTTEAHNYLSGSDAMLMPEFDDTQWSLAQPAKPLDTEYLFSDCPADGVAEVLPVSVIGAEAPAVVYDCGKNTSGYPVLELHGNPGDVVTVTFAEERTPGGTLHPAFIHGQSLNYICDGKVRKVRPLFTWFGFRYFSVSGAANVECVEVVHTKIRVSSHFQCDNSLLNWIHETFLNTQLTNMHAGIPSDCPHLERRGYTGDGQLICHAAMNMLDGESFYRKWIQDILDCQDQSSGHVQYTAPYTHSGGGPGGWGSAIVEVPWQFYLHYGDLSVLQESYPYMLRYFDYLESHSSSCLVISDKEGEWCLGDWCPPISVILPAPFVNNYFYIKALSRCIEIAKIIGEEQDIPQFSQRLRERKDALVAAYYNKWDGNFLGCVQGANAFALDIGLGDERTYPNLVEYYRKQGCFDTGIFGTDIVTRVLFSHGDGQLAVDLLLSEHVHSFREMQRRGATTLWEYWPESLTDRSHNHPMFGAVTAYLYDYLLGIQQKDDSSGYQDVIIAPVLIDGMNELDGYRTLPCGKVHVAYTKSKDEIKFCITIPRAQIAVFQFRQNSYALCPGENHFTFTL